MSTKTGFGFNQTMIKIEDLSTHEDESFIEDVSAYGDREDIKHLYTISDPNSARLAGS